MDDLVGWLTAQIDEDEEHWDAHSDRCLDPQAAKAWCTCGGYKRWLAECDAKRRIVELHHPKEWYAWDPACQLDVPDSGPPCGTLRLLALPYADRPGYREQWRLRPSDTP